MKITKTWLKEKGACRDGITWFEGHDLEGVELEDLMGILMVEHGGWAEWLASQSLWTGALDYVLPNGTRREEHWVRGQRHREGGPAMVMTQPDGYRYEMYYVEGQRHREGGPAMVMTQPDGYRYEAYYVEDQLHREGGPAVVATWPDGTRREEHWVRGQRQQ